MHFLELAANSAVGLAAGLGHVQISVLEDGQGHRPGRDAFMALERARKTVSQGLGCRSSKEVIFTSGATEANNMAILGVAHTLEARGRHLITQATEHSSVIEPLLHLAEQGWDVARLLDHLTAKAGLEPGLRPGARLWIFQTETFSD